MVSHLGSERFAACRTRPQYVLRSYWDAGRSLLPGREADMSDMRVVVLLRVDLRRGVTVIIIIPMAHSAHALKLGGLR